MGATDTMGYWRWVVAMALGALLRVWGPLGDVAVRHPDEFFLVYWPLYFSTGDFNHQHTLTAFYPAFHYYLLAALYFVYFGLLKLGGLAWSLDQWVAYEYFWGTDALVRIGRWTTWAFALGTIWWAGCLARRIWGEAEGWVAALLTAVCTLHVRQSGLVAVDVPMTFWFIGAVWAAVRLMGRADRASYCWAGALVGLAAGAKYPGALAAVAVVTAHLSAGRGILDMRLWLAAAMSIAAFFVVTPYTFLDFSTFAGHFVAEASHLQQGHAGQALGLGWWYHLRVSLPSGLGWAGVALAVCGGIAAWQKTRGRVLLASVAAYYLVMGSGELNFVRYALPLVVLGAVLISGAIARVGVPWRYILLLLTLVEPLYGSVRIAQLQRAGDTRAAARQWILRELPSGATCCNFGGWAGDVPVATVEGLWGRIGHYERLWGREKLDELRPFLLREGPEGPFYSYPFSVGNDRHRGERENTVEVLRRHHCDYVLLHRHALSYSHVDTTFASVLALQGELLARFGAGDVHAPRYDSIDAYYLPIGAFGELERAGPEIEIWRVGFGKPTSWTKLNGAFAQAYVLGAMVRLEEGAFAAALALVQQGIRLDTNCTDGYLVSAYLMEKAERDADAVFFYEKALELEPGNADSWIELGNARWRLADEVAARRAYARALAVAPDHPQAAVLRQAVAGE